MCSRIVSSRSCAGAADQERCGKRPGALRNRQRSRQPGGPGFVLVGERLLAIGKRGFRRLRSAPFARSMGLFQGQRQARSSLLPLPHRFSAVAAELSAELDPQRLHREGETLRLHRDRIDLQPLRPLVRAVKGRPRRTLVRSHHMQHDPQLETRVDLQKTLPDRLRLQEALAPPAHALQEQTPLTTPRMSSWHASPL